jgi:hypothetical protein
MPGVPSEVISKGSGLVKVDAQLNTPAGRQELLQKLSELPADQDRTEAYLFILQTVCNLTPGEINYLRRWWFSKEGFWPNQYPIEPLLRRSMLKAIAMAGGLPIDTYWLTVGQEFRMILTRSAWQVTRLMLTPEPDPIALLKYGKEYNIVILHQTAVPISIIKRDYEGHIITLDIGGNQATEYATE